MAAHQFSWDNAVDALGRPIVRGPRLYPVQCMKQLCACPITDLSHRKLDLPSPSQSQDFRGHKLDPSSQNGHLVTTISVRSRRNRNNVRHITIGVPHPCFGHSIFFSSPAIGTSVTCADGISHPCIRVFKPENTGVNPTVKLKVTSFQVVLGNCRFSKRAQGYYRLQINRRAHIGKQRQMEVSVPLRNNFSAYSLSVNLETLKCNEICGSAQSVPTCQVEE